MDHVSYTHLQFFTWTVWLLKACKDGFCHDFHLDTLAYLYQVWFLM